MEYVFNPIWSLWHLSDTFLRAMDGRDEKDDREPPAEASADPASESTDDLYELYCAYREEGRTAMLRLAVAPQSRRTLSQLQDVLTREEFEQTLREMPRELRQAYLRRITAGYEAARLMHFDEMLQKYKRAA